MTLAELVSVLSKAKASVYHFTDTRNLPFIRQHGLLSMVELTARGIIPIAGGNQWSLDADKFYGMDKYVHVCFFRDHPMAYVAQQEGRVETIRYLRIKPEIMLHPARLSPIELATRKGPKSSLQVKWWKRSIGGSCTRGQIGRTQQFKHV